MNFINNTALWMLLLIKLITARPQYGSYNQFATYPYLSSQGTTVYNPVPSNTGSNFFPLSNTGTSIYNPVPSNTGTNIYNPVPSNTGNNNQGTSFSSNSIQSQPPTFSNLNGGGSTTSNTLSTALGLNNNYWTNGYYNGGYTNNQANNQDNPIRIWPFVLSNTNYGYGTGNSPSWYTGYNYQ